MSDFARSKEGADSAAVLPPPRRRNRRLLSDEIRDEIVQEFILNGAVAPGGRLPTEAELCARYQVSRITVRAALRSLQQSGFITVRQGRGSTVLPRAETIPSGLDQLCSFETFASVQGQEVDTVDLEIEEVVLSEKEAARLAVAAGTRAVVVRRVKRYDGQRVGWIVDYVPEEVLAPQQLIDEFDGSVLDVLLAHPELEVDYSDCDLDAMTLNAELASRLGTPVGSPVLYLDELTRTRQGRIVNWSQAWLLPRYFRFFIRRRRQFDLNTVNYS